MPIKPFLALWSAFILAILISAIPRVIPAGYINRASIGLVNSKLDTRLLSGAFLPSETSAERLPLNPESMRVLGLALIQKKDQETGQAYLEKAAESGNPLAHYDLADVHVAQGNWELAARHIHQAQPDGNQIINRFMDQLNQDGRSSDAISLAREYTSIHPDAAPTYYRLANLYWELGDREHTIEALKNALFYDRDTRTDSYDYQAARLAYLQNNYLKAEELLNSVLQRQPEYFPALVLAGQTAIAQGDSAAAEVFLDQAIRLNPEHVWSHVYLAMAYQLQDKLDAAADEYELASIIATNPADHLDALAEIYRRSGNHCKQAEIDHLIQQYDTGIRLALGAEYRRIDLLCAP